MPATEEIVTQEVKYENPYYDPREYLDDDETVENPNYDPELYHYSAHPVAWVSVYAVTRHCYGPEEGGNWGNRNDLEVTIPMMEPGSQKEIDEIIEFLKPRYPNEGNIYSVLGGVEYFFAPEASAGGFVTPPYRGYE